MQSEGRGPELPVAVEQARTPGGSRAGQNHRRAGRGRCGGMRRSEEGRGRCEERDGDGMKKITAVNGLGRYK